MLCPKPIYKLVFIAHVHVWKTAAAKKVGNQSKNPWCPWKMVGSDNKCSNIKKSRTFIT